MTTKTCKTPKRVKTMAAQGDVLLRRVDRIPDGTETTEAQREGSLLIVAHSETGHHHAIDAVDARLLETQGGLVAYLVVDGAYADLVHHRSFDTHAPLRLPKGTWEIRRQREHTPEGWQRVAD